MTHAAEGLTASRVGSTDEGRVRSPDAALFMHTGEVDVAKALVKRYHYSHRFASNVQLCCTWHEAGGLFGDSGDAVGACTFSIPPTRWSENVWELSRLVRTPEAEVKLTGLIGAALRYIRSINGTDLVVSFADWTEGHHGGIYQAASWNYHGQRDPAMDGVIVHGQFVPGRAANSRWGTRSPERLVQMGIDATPHYDKGKHLYWRALSRSGQRKADRLGLLQLPYPKPDGVAA